MANTDRPFGFKPVGHLMGSSWNGKANVYYIPSSNATALFKGDAVQLTGGCTDDGKYPAIAQATAGDPIVGVIIGFGEAPNIMIKADYPNRVHCPVSTEMYALVVDDPFVIFEIQEDSVGAAITSSQIGFSTDITIGTGSTTTGLSAMELDSSLAATANGQCKILRAVNREDNTLGDNCKWEVLIVEHELLTALDATST